MQESTTKTSHGILANIKSDSSRSASKPLTRVGNSPRVIKESREPRNPVSKTGPEFLWFSIRFDRVIKKPTSTSYIRLVISGQTYYKVDTLSAHATISSDQITLLFAIPYAAISMHGTYAILIDRGGVVGQGCSFDGPPTPGVTSTSDWQFSPGGICATGFSLAPPWFTYSEDVNECSSFTVPCPCQCPPCLRRCRCRCLSQQVITFAHLPLL
ncbi:uncharacterized protein [Montipora capricornis]|uniref:uncharacterized protein isoform X2 n=1 Tax=Montipora capricornis TaxID=246305 RepID=UPI0035F1052E